MGAILSTGEETCKVKVMGNLPKNNSWTNIAIRWEKLKFTDHASYEASKMEYNNDISLLGGLQLFLNLEMIGHSLLPEEKDCTCTIKNCDLDDQANFECKKQTTAREPLTQPTMMIGCNKTQDDPTLTNFAGGVFDEVAFWNKRIPDEEKHMFLGGCSKYLESLIHF